MRPGTILGHEGGGVVEELGSKVRNLEPVRRPQAGGSELVMRFHLTGSAEVTS